MSWLIKLGKTISILTTLGMARMFGEYEHSGWNGDFEFARYRWRGQSWVIPTGAVEEDS